MQFTTFALSALSIGSALAASTTSSAASSTSTGQITVHVVKVGNANGTLAYSPNNVQAKVGDMVQFQFAPANHTVTQSTFAQPCQPIALNQAGTTGFYSGFMPVSATSMTTPTYSIMINNTTPIWIYCSQAKHCQNGMTMVINENAATNKTLAAFQALAKVAPVNLPGDATSVNGSTSSTSGTSSTTSGTSGSSNSGGNSGTTSTSKSTSTSSAASSKSTSGSPSIRASDALTMGGVLAMAMILFL